MNNELQTFTAEMLPVLEQEMRSVLRADRANDAFYGMMHYHMGWVNAELQPVEVAAGKRIRPLLCLLITQAAGGNWQQAVPAAAAIELLHNFSLIHDDIEDASPTRRGRETLWKIWGIEQAINSGDAMFALAHLAMTRLADRGVDPAIVIHALRRFDETCVALTEGQHADMAFEKRSEVSVADYLAMITGKTAVLLGLCGELGALIAGQPQNIVEHYAQFGQHLGLAFQVKDDILGIWGDESRTGKSAATDIITKKKTLPVLYGLSKSTALRDLYQQTQTDETFVRKTIEHLNQLGAREYATDIAISYSNTALEHLHAAQPAGLAAQALHQLAEMLLKRDY